MVHHHPNEPIQNHLEHNLENVSYGVWHEMNPLDLLPKTQKYYLQKESKHLVTIHLLHFFLDFSLVVLLFVSFELYSLSTDVLSSHNSNTIFPSLDLDLPFLELLWFPDPFPLSFFLPMFSMIIVLPDVSPVLFLHISSLRITQTTSSNFRVFEPKTKLLTTMTKPFHLSFNEHRIRRAMTSSSKSTFIELS
jgi:hypothetical protein